MSPILVRPVREQFEHDRVIRVLQARYKRKYEVAINPGAEQNASVGVGDIAMYPDLVLFSQERNRKLQATIEVETTESINTLEAMAEWGPFSRLRAQFFLYVPPNAIDTVRRLCAEHRVEPAEIWTYHTAIDQVRFTMVHRAPESAHHKSRPPDRVEIHEPGGPREAHAIEKPPVEPKPAVVTKQATPKPAAPKPAAPVKKAAPVTTKKTGNGAAKSVVAKTVTAKKGASGAAKKATKSASSKSAKAAKKPAKPAKSARSRPAKKAPPKKPSKPKRR